MELKKGFIFVFSTLLLISFVLVAASVSLRTILNQ
jgi:hypothetical protein